MIIFVLSLDESSMVIARERGYLIETDLEKVREMALSALDVSHEELLDADDHDECGRYLCESEIADALMVEIVNDTFRSDVDVLLRLGRREDAMNVIRGIVDALRETESYITGWDPDGPGVFADELEEVMQGEDPLSAFDRW